MISLNDYLYSGNTVLKILHDYSSDLKQHALVTDNPIDLTHSNFMVQMIELLEHNDFLSFQAGRINEFCKYMSQKYPFLSFTFKGRIKSLIRAEEKFNGYIVKYIYNYYKKNNRFPSVTQISASLTDFRDLLAYRIVISLPKCYLEDASKRQETELKYLYEIANELPGFMKERGFTPEVTALENAHYSSLLNKELYPYYRDYVYDIKDKYYQSLHLTMYDNSAWCYVEMQLRTKDMDDVAEIGLANHLGYEKRQERERARRGEIPEGECLIFDEAYERGMLLQKLELSTIDVNMFAAVNNSLINDSCGLFRGRQIMPYEHLATSMEEAGEQL